ncbi:MAG: GntR family transcriptional regulator [Oscillospiraceae bacterium]|nr:GntR family transcriptional regulator [Oscillospiraceae bacterium]
MINLDFKSGKTIHEQIEEGIKSLIISGVLKKDERLPSVRELSLSLTVNPNTVQRAYRELEAGGFIRSIKGKGNFVLGAGGKDRADKAEKAYERLCRAVRELSFLGEEKKDILSAIEEIYTKKEGSL